MIGKNELIFFFKSQYFTLPCSFFVPRNSSYPLKPGTWKPGLLVNIPFQEDYIHPFETSRHSWEPEDPMGSHWNPKNPTHRIIPPRGPGEDLRLANSTFSACAVEVDRNRIPRNRLKQRDMFFVFFSRMFGGSKRYGKC